MKLYWELFVIIFKKFVLRRNTGEVIRKFYEKMGIVYIKFAQILAMQNIGNLFKEEDRQKLMHICDNCKPIPFEKIETILRKNYPDFDHIFASIDSNPLGSASISQVHRGVLKTGEEVAIKIKREDIVANIPKEINRLKKLTHRCGKLFGFVNMIGGDKALNLYLNWILEEIDFYHEQKNMLSYETFTKNSNGRVKDTVKIVVPKLYQELSNEEVIVMEYILIKQSIKWS